jgi:hypothetical protein
MNERRLRTLMIVGALAAAGMTWACDTKGDGNLEKVGEKLDNASDDATRKSRDITDGAAENLGEKVDQAAGNKSARDNN